MTAKRKFAYPVHATGRGPVLALSEPDVLLRQFVTAAQNAVQPPKPAAIMVSPETLRVLLDKLKGA